ncbi:MAG: M12 family metallopeptidase [Bryobacteraceae bacterium]|nr:hypothetical protein [Solibacteraceae bacterium]MCO5350151.1 M12 family metallopeptidase [Bryobacteraceae bacterium]
MNRAALLLFLVSALLAQSPSAEFHSGSWRGQPIEYRIMDGWALVEGDILLAPLSEIEPASAEAYPSGKLLRGVVIDNENRRWPGAVVHYVIDPGMRNPQRVVEAIRHWEERTPFRFVERTTQSAYVRIRSVDSGCSAAVGRTGGEQFVNLADGCSMVTTVHELGHTIGFWHTQARLDRDRHIRVRYENIERSAWGQYDSRLSDGVDVGPYDYGSVMHYPDRGFASKPGPTMQSIPLGIAMGVSSGLSAADEAAAWQLAGQTPPEVTVTTAPPGLTVVVDGQQYTTPARFPWKPGEVHRVSVPLNQDLSSGLVQRHRFVDWSHDAEAGPETDILIDESTFVYQARYQQMARLTVPRPPVPMEGGWIDVWPASEDFYYPAGTEIRLTAHPNPGLKFHRWQDSGRDGFSPGAQFVGWSANPLTFRIERDSDMIALFTGQPLTTITSTAPHISFIVDNARVFPPASFVWEPGSQHQISVPERVNTFVSSIVHQFQNWSHGAAALHSYTAGAESATLTANYRTAYSIAVREATGPQPGNIRLTPSSPDGLYDHGLLLTIEGLDTGAGRFLHWTGNLGGTRNPEQLVIEEPAQFIAVSAPGGGIPASSFLGAATQQAGPFVPGQSFILYRLNDGFTTPAQAQHWGGLELPVEMAGVRVLFNGHPAPLREVSGRSITGIVPEQIAGQKSAFITVFQNGQLIGQRFVSIMPSSPGVFTRRGTGQGDALAWNEDWVNNTPESPAGQWRQFHFLATGFGATNPPESSARRTQQVRPVCHIGVELGVTEVEVTNIEAYDDLPPGVFRIWARVPEGLSPGRHMLFVTCDGTPSQPGVWVYTK